MCGWGTWVGMALAKDAGSFQKTCLGDRRGGGGPVLIDNGFPSPVFLWYPWKP